MPNETMILALLGIGVLSLLVMALWTIQKTLQQGFNEIIKGLEEIATRLRDRDR